MTDLTNTDDLTRDTLADLLVEALDRTAEEQGLTLYTTMYEQAGVMTSDAGFVVRAADGSEFQVTVVRSR